MLQDMQSNYCIESPKQTKVICKEICLGKLHVSKLALPGKSAYHRERIGQDIDANDMRECRKSLSDKQW